MTNQPSPLFRPLDAATLNRQIEARIAELRQLLDLPSDVHAAVQVAERKMRPEMKDNFGGPEPDDAWGASQIVAVVNAFLTERTMHAAWRKRAEEAEAALSAGNSRHE